MQLLLASESYKLVHEDENKETKIYFFPYTCGKKDNFYYFYSLTLKM